MKNDLIERYIYAATRRLPSKQRADVANELETLISDMLSDRCGDVQPEEKDVRVVLTELGTPNELADKYSTDKANCLIGSPHYTTYKYILKIVLIAALCGLTVALILSFIVEPQAWYTAVAEWMASMWSTALQAFAIVTIVFAVLYRKGVSLDSSKSLDDLPEVPKKNERISRVECFIDIAFTAIFTALLMFVPQVFTGYASISGEIVTTVNLFGLEVLKNSAPILIALAAVNIANAVVRLVEGRYSKIVAISSGVTGIARIALTALLLTRDGFFNPELDPYLAEIDMAATDVMQNFLLTIIVIAIIIEIVKAVYMAVKSSR